MYRVVDYGDMIADAVRMNAFVAALRAAVTPGCVVVDIGTGTGIFALLACSPATLVLPGVPGPIAARARPSAPQWRFA